MTHPSPNPCRAGANPLDDVKNSRRLSMVHLLRCPVRPQPEADTILEVSVEQRPIPSFVGIGSAFNSYAMQMACQRAESEQKILQDASNRLKNMILIMYEKAFYLSVPEPSVLGSIRFSV